MDTGQTSSLPHKESPRAGVQTSCPFQYYYYTSPLNSVLRASSPDNSLSDKSLLMLSNTCPSVFLSFFFPAPHHSLAHIVFFSSKYMDARAYHFNLLSCTFLDISPTFVVPLFLSFVILSSLVTSLIHLNILISTTSNFFSCVLQCACPGIVHHCLSYNRLV